MNLLLTGCFKYSEEQMQKLSLLGYDIHYMQQESGDLPTTASTFDAVVCNGLFLHHNIDDFSSLKLIQLTSAGLDRVPLEKIKQRGIRIENARGVYSIPMAEWALSKVLDAYKNVQNFYTSQQNHEWVKVQSNRELFGTSVAIIGAGNVGQEVAKRFHAMGCRITGFDIHKNETPYFDAMALTESLETRISDFDIVIITAPLLPSTKGLISRKVLENLKKNAVLVNIARGGLIDENAMCEVLSERNDVFAALDVFETEPLPFDSPLWNMANVVISPHNSFVSDGNNSRMFDVIYNNMQNLTNK